MFPVKICGIANRESLELVLKYPVSAIGFIFYHNSPRFIKPTDALELTKFIPVHVSTVGVFVNEPTEKINTIAEQLNLDFIQLHGNESPEYCSSLSYPTIKALRVGREFSLENLNNYNVHSFLLDTYQPGLFGGTGDTFNWELLQNLELDIPIILSGGLNQDNVQDGIQKANPVAIDVNSGVESCAGQKDEGKLKKLFENLKNLKCEQNIFSMTEKSEL